MKGLTKQDKDAIRDALMAYCENFPSRNRASESLQGVSAAVVSQILNTKYESISDDMFSRIAAQIGFSFEHWTICESENFRLATCWPTPRCTRMSPGWWAMPDAARPLPP